jgi:hypothetical protein
MRKQDEIRIVLGSKRYAGSTIVDEQIQLPLFGQQRSLVQGDRSSIVSLDNIFDGERQTSNTFRLNGKIVNLFNNAISGKTYYTPFKNSLYYLNPEISINTNVWSGFPQYDEFSLIRTSGITGHVDFKPKSASTYNWSFYTSYAYSSTTAQTMTYTSEKFNVTNQSFNVASGIPFVMGTGTTNGKSVVYFYFPNNHNLQVGQWVELTTSINNKYVFQVFSLGDGEYRSEEKVFTIFNLSFSSNDVYNGRYGNFKRIGNITNSGETKSRYYVRLHKIITNNDETFVTKLGFENNPFPVKRKLEFSAITPNQVQRVSVKTGTQSYGFSVNKDIDIQNLIDNNGKPISELFFTIVNKGYMGWFNKPSINQTSALEIGWEFNFLKNTMDNWWNKQSTFNKDNIPYNFYTKQNINFYYNEELNVGDTIKGDFCEYNDIEQKEYVLSPLFHKYSVNPILFLDVQTSGNTNLPSGYAYKPHYSIPIRVYSDYIESARLTEIDQAPFYSYFSDNTKTFIWRDIYSYGYIDSNNLGLNIPFINNAHYPFREIVFIQYPMKRNVSNIETTIINDPITDNCE